MKTIGDVVEGREAYFVRIGTSVREAALYMAERRVGCVAVLEEHRLVGVLSERDVMARVVAKGLDPDRLRVEEVMTRDVAVADSKDSHDEGARKMRQVGCRHLPVVSGDRLVGMVSLRDLLQADLSEKDEEIRWLNAYVHFVPPEGHA